MSRHGLARFEEALARGFAPGDEAEVWFRLPVQLGDLVMALPTIWAIQQRWRRSAAEKGIGLRFVFTGKRSASLFSEADPGIAAQCLVDEDTPESASPWRIRKLWGQRPPVALINFSKSDRIKLAAWIGGVPVRAGIRDGGNNWCYHFSHPFLHFQAPGHRIFRYRPLLEWLAGPGAQPLFLPQTPERMGGGAVLARLAAAGWSGGSYVVFGPKPHARTPQRQWFPKDQPWIRLAALARAEGHLPVFVGGPEHRADLEALAGKCQGVSLAGDTSLPGLAALMAGSFGCVCVDSGPAHLAAATGAATVVLFGYGIEYYDLPNGPRVVALRGAPAGTHPYDEAASDFADADHPWCRATANLPPGRVWAVVKALAAEGA